MDRKLYVTLLRNAESSYSPDTSAQYREADDLARETDSHAGKCTIIREVSERFSRPIDVLDLGCGTGRYFHCVQNVKSLVGVDPASHMLEHARRPVAGGNRNVQLIRSTLHEVAFRPHSFDLIVCVGVLAFWCPFDRFVLERVHEMLRPGGVLFVTLVERLAMKSSWKRDAAMAVRPILFGPLRRYVEVRLQDFTISEARARALSQEYFEHVDVTRWHSPTGRIDLHCVLSGPRPAVRRSA